MKQAYLFALLLICIVFYLAQQQTLAHARNKAITFAYEIFEPAKRQGMLSTVAQNPEGSVIATLNFQNAISRLLYEPDAELAYRKAVNLKEAESMYLNMKPYAETIASKAKFLEMHARIHSKSMNYQDLINLL
jgi:hypothetical protein